MVFGIADQVVRDMQVHVPEVAEDATFQSTYWSMTSAHSQSFGGATTALSSFTGGISVAVIAGTPSSSGSGSGGSSFSSGFFGGGGGGGSDGGGGAD